MRDRRVPIAVISLTERYLVMEGGLRLPITDMYDDLGDETDDPDEVVRIEAGTPEIGYIVTPIKRQIEYELEH